MTTGLMDATYGCNGEWGMGSIAQTRRPTNTDENRALTASLLTYRSPPKTKLTQSLGGFGVRWSIPPCQMPKSPDVSGFGVCQAILTIGYSLPTSAITRQYDNGHGRPSNTTETNSKRGKPHNKNHGRGISHCAHPKKLYVF